MASGSTKHQSGEYDYVSTAQFNTFVEMFRDATSDTRARLDSINDRLANGQSDMAVMKSELKQTIVRTDDHSDVIKVLSNTFQTKIASEHAAREATEHALKPFGKIKERIINTVVTAVVASACAVIWHLIILVQPTPPSQPVQTNVTVSPGK